MKNKVITNLLIERNSPQKVNAWPSLRKKEYCHWVAPGDVVDVRITRARGPLWKRACEIP